MLHYVQRVVAICGCLLPGAEHVVCSGFLEVAVAEYDAMSAVRGKSFLGRLITTSGPFHVVACFLTLSYVTLFS